MKTTKISLKKSARLSAIVWASAALLGSLTAHADSVTQWNYYAVLATKGATPNAALTPNAPELNAAVTTGNASIALNSNISTRIEAIQARAVFDAVNAISPFSPRSYYHTQKPEGKRSSQSAAAAAAQAAHDVLLALLPASAPWNATRTWLDAQLANDLAALGVDANDAGIHAGQAAAAAAVAARKNDFSAIRSTYTPSTNLTTTGTATDQGNPGVGLWRPTNSGPGDIDPLTGTPSGFAQGQIQPAAAIDYNWKNITPFSVTNGVKRALVAAIAPSLDLTGNEYASELEFIRNHGQDASHPGSRTPDQLAQALFYKQDAELTVNELTRIASAAHKLTLTQNAKLFALVANASADARIAAWQAKYELAFWRPITALNADVNGSTAQSAYAWRPLAATPSHPSSSSGHSANVGGATEILRAYFKTDDIAPKGATQTLTTLPWLIGFNNGTGSAGTFDSRAVKTFSAVQLENGNSRIYLGVHFGIDNYQGQQLGLTIADSIIQKQSDPAASGLKVFKGNTTVASTPHLRQLLVADSTNTGYFGGL